MVFSFDRRTLVYKMRWLSLRSSMTDSSVLASFKWSCNTALGWTFAQREIQHLSNGLPHRTCLSLTRSAHEAWKTRPLTPPLIAHGFYSFLLISVSSLRSSLLRHLHLVLFEDIRLGLVSRCHLFSIQYRRALTNYRHGIAGLRFGWQAAFPYFKYPPRSSLDQ